MTRMRLYILLSSIVCMSTVATAQELGLKKITNWLKFPPVEHPGWSWKTVAGVDFDSKGNLYISSRGGTTPPLTVWKPDGTLLRVFPGPKVLTWDHKWKLTERTMTSSGGRLKAITSFIKWIRMERSY